jgi:putative aldouronate transport system permease protein
MSEANVISLLKNKKNITFPVVKRKRFVNRGNRISFSSNISLNILFIVVSAFVLIPFVLLLAISITDNQTLIDQGYKFFPNKISLKAYSFLLAESNIVINAYGITIYVTVIGTVLHVLISSFFAYPLSKRDLPYNRLISFILFFTMMFNGGLVATYIINTQFMGFRDKIYALILPYLMNPWHIFVIKTYFQTSIPESIEESAKIDGASYIRIFFQLILPISKPVLATIALFSAIIYWNDWFQSLLYISKENLFSLQFVMLKAMRQIEVMERLAKMGTAGDIVNKLAEMPSATVQFAMVIISIGPIVLLYPFFQRYFVKGITLGSTKG